LINLRLGAPVTVLYRGNLQDTASLVGLAHSRARVGIIAFTGELTNDMKQYCEVLNTWLSARDLPRISIHPTLTSVDLDRVVGRAYESWNWGEKECEAAVHLAGLPLPPK
jgi:hypothetical protein